MHVVADDSGVSSGGGRSASPCSAFLICARRAAAGGSRCSQERTDACSAGSTTGCERWERTAGARAQDKVERVRERMERYSPHGGWFARRLDASGNAAFDEYRAETLRRLEDEQREFKGFLDRLRVAKDRAEFDQFMAQRRRTIEPRRRPRRTPAARLKPASTVAPRLDRGGETGDEPVRSADLALRIEVFMRFCRHRQLYRQRRTEDGRQRRHRAGAAAADQGRARHRQDAARPGDRRRARRAADRLAHQIDHPRPAGPLRIRRRLAPARQPARRRARLRHPQLHQARQAVGGVHASTAGRCC